MIIKGSRYENSDVTAVVETDGRVIPMMHIREPMTEETVIENDPDFTRHTVQVNDQLDELAWRYFDDERKWWVIADVNNLFDVFDLEEGAELIIPSKKFIGSL